MLLPRELERIHNQMLGFDRTFERMALLLAKDDVKYPPHNIIKVTDDKFNIELALAGFTKEQLNIEVKDRGITIHAEAGENDGESTSRRIARRSFSKTFYDYSNKLDLERITAKFENGLLVVKVPPVLEAKPQKIVIE